MTCSWLSRNPFTPRTPPPSATGSGLSAISLAKRIDQYPCLADDETLVPMEFDEIFKTFRQRVVRARSSHARGGGKL